MALGDLSNPIRFGQGQHVSDTRSLYLEVFGGEVLTAFDLATSVLDKHNVKTVGPGQKSWRFPKVWKASAEYHTPGQELLGNDIETGEITVTIDDILVAHTGISDLDEMLSHFDVRGPFSNTMGHALAKVFDKNVYRQTVLAARAAADGPFPGGNQITSDTLKATAGAYDGAAWIDAIRDANHLYDDNDVPETERRYIAVVPRLFDAIKWAKDSNGNYLVLDRDFGHPGAGGIGGRAQTLDIDGVTVIKSRNIPNTNESADNSVYTKYRGDYSKTLAVMWTPMAVATVKMLDIGFEMTRDTRRLEDFLVAKMLVGHGILRPECAIEFASVT